jgi:hypothetical protein
VPPNAMRVLRYYGLVDSLMKKGAIEIEGVRFLNYKDGEVLYRRKIIYSSKKVVDPLWYVSLWGRPTKQMNRPLTVV